MLEVYTDAAVKGNPGPGGIGIVIKANGNTFEYALRIGNTTNHVAEFYAVMEALKYCEQHYPGEILSFRSDSQVVVQAIEKNFTKNKAFQPLLDEINTRAGRFPFFFIKWIPEKKNLHADRLAKQALHQ